MEVSMEVSMQVEVRFEIVTGAVESQESECGGEAISRNTR
jgi:hypothetical protein